MYASADALVPSNVSDSVFNWGLAGLICSLFISILGIIFSAIAMGKAKRCLNDYGFLPQQAKTGRTLGIIGLVIGIVSTVLGILLGVVSAIRKGKLADNVLTVAGMIGVAIPQFLFGVFCIILFCLNLKWFPVGQRGSGGILDELHHLFLPAFVLGISMTAGVMRYSRSSMLDSMNRDYVKTARAKGLPEWKVNLFHGFRVACTPVMVLIGFRLPMLISGSIVIENIFQWPGVGRWFTDAVKSQNTPIIMSVGLFMVLLVLLSSLLVDVLTAILDPRVKLS